MNSSVSLSFTLTRNEKNRVLYKNKDPQFITVLG